MSTADASTPPQRGLALFDLDHTLLDGDSDVLWCAFMIAQGMLDGPRFARRSAEMDAAYRTGSVEPATFAGFYVSLLAGHTAEGLAPLRETFLRTEIIPRIPPASMDLVRAHQEAGDLVVLTTATNRYITELTATHLGIEHLIATEAEVVEGVFTGRTEGLPNMRAGKVTRLHAWLAARGASLDRFRSTAYSDSANDLPLLEAADTAVVVNADERLAALAAARGWRSLSLRV